MSHNTSGWSEQKANILQTLLASHKPSVVSMQEHMQLKSNLYKIKSNLHGYEAFSLPAYKSNEFIHKGRPSCGLSILYRRDLMNYVEHFVVPNSARVQAIKVTLPNAKFVIVNSYFPTDPRTVNFDDTELLKVLQDIRFVLDSCDTYIPIIMGDFNTDFSRNSRFVNIVQQFFRRKESDDHPG